MSTKRKRSQRKSLKRSLIDSTMKKYFKKEAVQEMDDIVLESIGKSEYTSYKEYKHDIS